ncbi:Vms1/Ankzf1 family peptidyl-tRNA hydrolase [Spirillospora albida]|uniref:baeRF2 domain-containing protein n=1 Tax=Spirillospora albida TaxID=58123 RepID=UPI0004C261F8|nr:Vms1/Ankzf1 family peptidyl-tRNA hydrolase [Spirillospora albida]
MDLSFLKTLYERPGPYTSVYADLTRTTEDAIKAADLRWRALREELVEQGAPAASLRAIDDFITGELAARNSTGLVLFAAGDEVVYAERLAYAPRNPQAHVGPLPHVLPYLAERGERFAHMLAVVDRCGGQIECVSADGEHLHIDVPGDEEYPIRKVKAGDWNQSRFQRSAENVWKSNAKKVAQEIDRAAERWHPEAVVIAGDTHARVAVLEEISDTVLEHTVESDRNIDKNVGVRDPDLESELDRLLELKAVERVMTVAERFERELANGQRAVSGLADTVKAARHGQVETLLLDDDPDFPARLWIGPEPRHVAATADELKTEFGVEDPTQARADAALVRAVAATDGDLIVLPRDNDLHVGAVLRYTT